MILASDNYKSKKKIIETFKRPIARLVFDRIIVRPD